MSKIVPITFEFCRKVSFPILSHDYWLWSGNAGDSLLPISNFVTISPSLTGVTYQWVVSNQLTNGVSSIYVDANDNIVIS